MGRTVRIVRTRRHVGDRNEGNDGLTAPEEAMREVSTKGRATKRVFAKSRAANQAMDEGAGNVPSPL